MNDQSSKTLIHSEADGTGAVKARASDPVVGETLKERYLVERQIGKGGFGAVYLARDLELLSKPVVIKLLHQTALENEWAVRKFKQEIEALARINHPGVVGVLATGSMAGGDPFIVMEYVEGVSLRSVMEAAPEGMDIKRAYNIINQICNALTGAHEKGVIHRDLKPENIMLRSLSGGAEQVKIIDFGIAKVKESRLAPSTMMGEMAGTVLYMAPEQLNAGEISGSTDLYSLGAIAYEMLTGRRPFNPATLFQLAEIQRRGVAIRPTDLRPSLPGPVDDVILRALAYDVEERYSSPEDFALALGSALDTDSNLLLANANTIALPRPGRSASVQQKKKKSNLSLMVAGIVLPLLLVAGVLIWWATRTHPTQNAGNAPVNTVPASTRTIDYYFMIQKVLPNKQPYQEPFKATGNDTLGDDWKFTLHTASPQSGYLYLLAEGPGPNGTVLHNLLYPTPKFSGGSAHLDANQDREIGPYQLDDHQGTERLWLVWSGTPVKELEAVKDVVNARDRGSVTDPQQESAISKFLLNYSKPDVEVDKANKVVHVRTQADLLVSLIELEHH